MMTMAQRLGRVLSVTTLALTTLETVVVWVTPVPVPMQVANVTWSWAEQDRAYRAQGRVEDIPFLN